MKGSLAERATMGGARIARKKAGRKRKITAGRKVRMRRESIS
jgi:hypothetical protein